MGGKFEKSGLKLQCLAEERETTFGCNNVLYIFTVILIKLAVVVVVVVVVVVASNKNMPFSELSSLTQTNVILWPRNAIFIAHAFLHSFFLTGNPNFVLGFPFVVAVVVVVVVFFFLRGIEGHASLPSRGSNLRRVNLQDLHRWC